MDCLSLFYSWVLSQEQNSFQTILELSYLKITDLQGATN